MRTMPQFKQHALSTRKKRAANAGKASKTPVAKSIIPTNKSKKSSRFTQVLMLVLGWTMITLMALTIIMSGYLYAQIRQFEDTSRVSAISLVQSALAARKINLFAEKDALTLLILGLDATQNRQSPMIMTDTIMLARVKSDGHISLLPLPRDLWIDSLKTKINALYFYGQESNETTGIELLNKIIMEITGISIDHHLVIDIDHLKEIIDAIGGVDVLVERSFVDEKYPAELSTNPPELAALYQTISFTQGVNHFTGDQALKFMRSRQSTDPVEGTDQARSKRQQRVIEALVNKIGNDRSIASPEALGTLLALWNKLDTSLDITTLVALGLHSLQAPISINALSIPVSNQDSAGIISNPPVSKHDQWVWEPTDPTWSEFKQWVSQHY